MVANLILANMLAMDLWEPTLVVSAVVSVVFWWCTCCRDQIYYLCWKFASFWQWYKCAIQHHWNSCYFVYVSQGVILCHFKPKPSVIIINWRVVTLWHLQNIKGISLLQLLNKSLHWRKTKHLFTDRALDLAKQLTHRLRNREGEIPQDQLILL